MKSRNKTTAALLDTGQNKIWHINIELRGGRWAKMRFNDRDLAQQEFNRIRSGGIYCGIWIENIELGEQVVTDI